MNCILLILKHASKNYFWETQQRISSIVDVLINESCGNVRLIALRPLRKILLPFIVGNILSLWQWTVRHISRCVLLCGFWGYGYWLSYWLASRAKLCLTCLSLCLILCHFPFSKISFPVLRASAPPQLNPPSAQCYGHRHECYMLLYATTAKQCLVTQGCTQTAD